MIEQKSNWFGSIPKEWSVTSLKKAISLAYRYPTYYGIDYVGEGILEVRGEMLRTDGQISLENSSPRYISLETSNRFPLTILEKGDLVISVRGTIGKVGIVDEDIAGSNITANLLRLKIIKKLFVPEYLFWLIRNHVFLAHLNNVSDSTTIKTITLPTFLSIEIPSPTLLVQNKIVKYLNQKVQSIDNIVVQKQNLINLLEQQRQSIITEAVTKGLNPNVKMKDSGVEWIGEIPENWSVKKVKYLISEPLSYGANESAELDDRELPRYIRITDIDDSGKLRESTFKSISKEIANLYNVKNGDILLARSGATVGKSYFHRESESASHAGYLIKLRAKNYKIGEYIYLYTQSYIYSQWINSNLIQATIQNVSAEKYANLYVSIPDRIEEVELIVNNIKHRIDEINSLIQKIKIEINLIKEYRQSLIYEAVTGKIDISEMELEEVR
ncbi:hypothetical protein CQS04_01835 [Chryseomicrobium excrementi]|uniref:Type I restriction modification DNA specificity domain-containing protein n=1 Tax=Chryseomicrobium excrementi TaxID=2041346 RepID=A0A2M9F2F8_9BACL|nr:restriction endonuclease subunit S [Chryseomicrobium excrementi]PJK17641.1 hypothetical protein CQS04_01835 [Chryseomicrobium excrementi]